MKHSTHDARLIAGATSRARGNTWGWGHAITYSLLTAQRRAGAASDAEQARHRDLVSEISAANQRGALALLRMLAARLPASARACRLAKDAADQARLELRVHLCTHDPIRWAGVPPRADCSADWSPRFDSSTARDPVMVAGDRSVDM